jgi:hypothetical protein
LTERGGVFDKHFIIDYIHTFRPCGGPSPQTAAISGGNNKHRTKIKINFYGFLFLL